MASASDLKSRIDLHELAEKLGMERAGPKDNYRSPNRKDSNPSVAIYDGEGTELKYLPYL